MMIPYCYRRIGGAGISASSVAKGILFDRLRIVRALKVEPAQLPLDEFPTEFIDKALSDEEKLRPAA